MGNIKALLVGLACICLLFAGCSPKKLNTAEYTGTGAFRLPYDDWYSSGYPLEGRIPWEELKIKGPIALYEFGRKEERGEFIAPDGIDIAETLAEAESIVVIRPVEHDFYEASSQFNLYVFDQDMTYKYQSYFVSDSLNEAIESLKEMDISRDNPDSLGEYAAWLRMTLDGSFASILNNVTQYPQSLNLAGNIGLLSREDMLNVPILLRPAASDLSIENEDPSDYERKEFTLEGKYLEPFRGQRSKYLVFSEEVGRKSIGTYGVSIRLWSPIFRISVIDAQTGALAAWIHLSLDAPPNRIVDPKPAEDTRYYYNFDEWEMFLELFSN